MKDWTDLQNYISYTNTNHPELLDDILTKTYDLIKAIEKLKETYESDNKLPLLHINTDLENLMAISEIIEDEVLKLGEPVDVFKEYVNKS